MADDFQAEVCGGSWWTSPITTTFNNSSFSGTYGGCWQNNILMNMKTTSTEDSSGCYTTAVLPDSAFPIMGSSPSTTTNWYQPLLDDGRTTGESCSQTLPEILNNLSDFGMDQEQTSSIMTNSGDCTENFVSTSYGYPSSLLQTLFDGTSSPPPPAPPQQLLYDLQKISEGLQLTNKAFFCNTPALDINNNRADVNSSKKIKSRNEEISSESTYKRPRIETPSPLPTFKVRKEKLGDRVTALQQLVSPFGKTDTASVLHEAIEYIKLLHDQINVLSDPYMKIGATMQVQQINGKGEDKKEGAKQQANLRSRGLCLVPVSCTFPVVTQTAPDYWTSCFKNRFK